MEASIAGVTAELFEKFNREGSRVFLTDESGGPGVDLGLVDSWRVVRVLPHAGTDGLDFWVGWRDLGWLHDPAPQHCHLALIRTWLKRDDDLLLHTADGVTLRVEFLATVEEMRAWEVSAAVRASRAWRDADRRQLDALREMANAG